MTKKKINYYNPEQLLKVDAEYNIILGQRANGKSYAVKAECIRQSWLDNEHDKFIYLRRWDIDQKQRESEKYFSDMDEIVKSVTNGEYDCLSVYQKVIYFSKSSDTGKITRGKRAGYCMALTQAEHYKSSIYLDVKNIIFEEFITSNMYLPREPMKLMQLMSTILRNREGHIYMIGNTISRVCPYVNEWGLVKLHKQAPGTIDVYDFKGVDEQGEFTVHIAVEYCEALNHASRMFFGQASKNITTGVWETTQKPHLKKDPSQYTELYKMVVEYENFKFFCRFMMSDKGSPFWYVEPKTTPIQAGTRVISDKVNINYMYSYGFTPINAAERQAFEYLEMNKIFYSDNLTGTDFEQCYKALRNLCR